MILPIKISYVDVRSSNIQYYGSLKQRDSLERPAEPRGSFSRSTRIILRWKHIDSLANLVFVAIKISHRTKCPADRKWCRTKPNFDFFNGINVRCPACDVKELSYLPIFIPCLNNHAFCILTHISKLHGYRWKDTSAVVTCQNPTDK